MTGKLKTKVRVHAGAVGALLFVLAAFGHFVGVTYGNGLEPPAFRAAAVAEADRARVTVRGGVPVLRLSGTPREMGRQHGRLLGPQIRFLIEHYMEALAYPTIGSENCRTWAKAVTPHIPEAYLEEMKGIAEGAEVPFESVLLANTFVDRFQSMFCSTVVAAGAATKGDEVIFGRNLDFPGRGILHKSTVVLVFAPEGGTRIAAVTWPGLVGVLSGMNEHGVAGATMLVHQGRDLRPGVPYLMMYRAALAGAKKTGDVHDHIAAAQRTCPNNFMVVDATGAAEVVEYDAQVCVRRPAVNGSICSTNHFRTEELADQAWRAGMRRYDILDGFLNKEHGSIDRDRVRRHLEETAFPAFLNVQAMIFLPVRRELEISVGGALPAAAQEFVHIDRETLFGAGEAPK